MEAKLDVNDLLTIGLTLGVTAIGIVYISQIQEEIRDDQFVVGWNCGQNATTGTGAGKLYTGCPADWNASNNGMNTTGVLAGKLPTIATVLAAAIIIGVLVKNFFFGSR